MLRSRNASARVKACDSLLWSQAYPELPDSTPKIGFYIGYPTLGDNKMGAIVPA